MVCLALRGPYPTGRPAPDGVKSVGGFSLFENWNMGRLGSMRIGGGNSAKRHRSFYRCRLSLRRAGPPKQAHEEPPKRVGCIPYGGCEGCSGGGNVGVGNSGIDSQYRQVRHHMQTTGLLTSKCRPSK